MCFGPLLMGVFRAGYQESVIQYCQTVESCEINLEK
jgi:hypothetical protein